MKAKMSEFNGVYFRSRLETRWCDFFTKLGVGFEYEPKALKTSIGGYIPDFYFRSLGAWVEIKGKSATTEEIKKLKDVCVNTGKIGFIISGYPAVYMNTQEPHLSNCSCMFISSKGVNVKFSLDELYQVVGDISVLRELNDCQANTLIKVDIAEYLRYENLEPAKAKFKPESKELINTTKRLSRFLSKLNDRLNIKQKLKGNR